MGGHEDRHGRYHDPDQEPAAVADAYFRALRPRHLDDDRHDERVKHYIANARSTSDQQLNHHTTSVSCHGLKTQV